MERVNGTVANGTVASRDGYPRFVKASELRKRRLFEGKGFVSNPLSSLEGSLTEKGQIHTVNLTLCEVNAIMRHSLASLN